MRALEDIVRRLCNKEDEQEWFEFKENWYEPVQLGEYISALSNAAAYHFENNAYFIGGVMIRPMRLLEQILINIVIIIKNLTKIILLEICLPA